MENKTPEDVKPDFEKMAENHFDDIGLWYGELTSKESIAIETLLEDQYNKFRSELTKLREENERLNSLLKKQTQLHIALLESQLSKAKELLIKWTTEFKDTDEAKNTIEATKQFLNEIS